MRAKAYQKENLVLLELPVQRGAERLLILQLCIQMVNFHIPPEITTISSKHVLQTPSDGVDYILRRLQICFDLTF